MSTSIKIVIGPDESNNSEGPGVDWTISHQTPHGWEVEGSYGKASTKAANERRQTTAAWLDYAKRNVRWGKRVHWGTATVTPYGYSQGPGHAPQGVVIEVRVAS